MKKLLLTLLGVMTLCGLSPHQLQAQDTREATLDDGTPVTDVARASALTTDLDGKLVRLQFPVNVLASGTMDGATKCKYMIYGRDPENNPVVMMSKVATAPGTDNGYVPGPAFKAATDNIWANTIFIPADGIVGKVIAENGHVIIVLKDEQQNIDNNKYCYKNAAKKFSEADIKNTLTPSNNIAYPLIGNTHHRVDNITPDDYGRMAWIRNVSYSGTEFTDKNGDEIPVKLKGEDGYIDATAYQIYSTLTTKTDHSLAICGIVELDATGKPYLMLRDCVSMVPVPSITLKDGSSTTISMTENGEKTEGSATLPIRTSSKLTVKPAFATNAAIKAVFYSGNGYNGVECWGTITGTVAVSEQAFRNGIARLTLSGVSATYNNKTMLIPSDRSEYTLTLIDPLLSSPSYDTFAELNAAKPEEGTTVVTSTKHYQHYTLNTSGEWPLAHGMVSYIRGNYMLVRDVKRNDDSSVADTQEQEPTFTLLKHTTRSSSIKSSSIYHNNTSTTLNGRAYYPRITQEGDGVAKAAGKVTYENKNLVIDLSNSYLPDLTSASHYDYASRDMYFTCEMNQSDKALFADQLEEWRISSVISNAKETTLDASYIGKVVEIKGASISNDGDAYTIGLKQPVSMSWFEGDAEMAKQQAILATADADAKFTLSGYVMNDGQGGVEIKLLSLDNTGEIIEVCDHPGHDSYCGDLSLDAYDGKVITLTGARIYKDTDDKYYTPIGGKNIHFEWTTNPDGATADKAAIKLTSANLADGNNRFASALLHDISAKVKKEGDDITLDVLSIKQIAALTPDEYGPNDLNVYVDGHLAKNNGTSGTAAYINSALTDFVRLTAQTPEGAQVIYAIVSENGNKNDAPAWATLEAGKDMKIDHKMELYVTGCIHGQKTLSVRRLIFIPSSHLGTAGSLNELIDYPAGEKTHIMMTGAARVVATAVVDGKPVAVVTGNDGSHYLLRCDNADAELPEAGTMISNFSARRISADGEGIGDINTIYTADLSHDFADYAFTPDPDEELPAITPATITDEHSTANAEKHVRLYDAKIGGNETNGLTITAGANSIRLNNALGCEIAGNEEGAQYVVTGIMLPRQGKRISRQAAEPGIASLADDELTLDDMEFLPLSIEKRRAVLDPTYALEGQESFKDGVAVTTDDVEMTMECDEPYSTVSYSLDGGESWTVYDGTTVKITESANVVIKASVLGFDDTTVSFEIRREYFSTEATIKAAPASGYTTVTIAPAAELEADSYKIYYTTDGTEPTTESALYTAPIESEKAASIRALVIENGKRPGKASEPVAVSVRAHDLEIKADKGEGFTTVTIAPKDPKHLHQNAEIRYTTDGTEPTAGSALYTAPFEVEASQNGMTVKAICIEPEKTAGQVATATIAVEGLRPSCDVAITYREAEGVYYITLTAEAGTIHYSLNGAEEKIYDGKPIEYTPATDGTCTVKAYAVEEGKKAGKTATESFQVTGISGIGADGEADGVKVEGNAITVPEGAQTFDIAGRRVNPQGLSRGIYIVRLASGKAVKVVIK